MVVFLVSIKVSTEPDFYRTLGSYWTQLNPSQQGYNSLWPATCNGYVYVYS